MTAPTPAGFTPRLGRATPMDRYSMLMPALAAALVGLGCWIGWRGVDLPAQLYRVAQIRHHGLTIWDSQWYGGHWTLNYSVLFPVTAAFAGWQAVSVMSAAAAALAFDRVAAHHFGRSARAASVLFAVSVIVQTSIGQLSFFLGEALGLWCVLAATRRRWVFAAILGVAASLASPLAGAFVGLGLASWAIAVWSGARRPGQGLGARPGGDDAGRSHALHLLGLVAATAVPIGTTAVLFPGQGNMPYPVLDWVWELLVVAILWALTPASERILRTGLVGYGVVATLSFVIPSPLGGNVGRLEDCLALPLAVLICWPRVASASHSLVLPALRRPLWPVRHRRVVFALAVLPLVFSQWAPAWGALTTNAGQVWTHRPFYAPLVSWLRRAGGPVARVEVVPTRDHWEAAYVAPAVPLARGWERQLDTADNPLFYSGPLTPATYKTWLIDNGVRYVALPDAPLDYAGLAEGALVATGVSGLRLVWHTPEWRLYQVVGAAGIVTGPARVTLLQGDQLDLVFDRAGTSLVRVRWSPSWQVRRGTAFLEPTDDGWMTVTAAGPETVSLQIGL